MSEFRDGSEFAGYTLRGLVSADEQGEVYTATHPRLPHPVTLRVLPPALSADPAFRATFYRDGVHDRGEFHGRLWITTAGNTPPDNSDDETQVVGPQQPPPRYIGSAHTPLPPPPVPAYAPPPPPHYAPAPPPQPSSSSRGGLMVVGAVVAVVLLAAAVVGVVVLTRSDDTSTAAPSSTKTTTTTRTTTTTTTTPTAPGNSRVIFSLDYQRYDIGNFVTCTPEGDGLLVTIRGGSGADIALGPRQGQKYGAIPGEWVDVRGVTLGTVDGTSWSMVAGGGHGSAVAHVDDDGIYHVDAGVLKDGPGDIEVRTALIEFRCP